MLEGTANSCIGEADGDGAEGGGVEFWVPLHDIEGALRRKGVIVAMDAVDDFAFFGLGVGGDGETWAYRSVSGFRARCAGRSNDDWFGVGRTGRDGGWIHERDSGGTELCLGRDDLGAAAEDVDGGRHVVVVWKC